MTPIPRKPHDAGSHDQQMTPAVQAVIDAADKRMPAGCTTPDGCRQHGCHGACLPRDMTPAETAIREALAAGPTPGPWKQERNAVLIAIAPYEWAEAYGGTEANARLIAACNPANVAELLAELDRLRAERDAAVGLLASWCVSVDHNGTGWDDWDEDYKDARYRPGPLRAALDKAIAEERQHRGITGD